MRPVLIVAKKEFRDHLTSKRFIAIFVVLMLLSIMGIVMGMDQYNNYLDAYKNNVTVSQQTSMYGYPIMPSALYFFGAANNGGDMGGGFFSIVLMLLSMALGFDLVTREREENSLKSLLSHPVYRDEVINGKLIGAAATLTVVMGCSFLITLAVMMFYGVVPTVDDLSRLVAYFIMALLYGGIFFAIAMLFSTVTRTSTMSILCVLGVIVALVIFPTFAPKIVSAVIGPAPAVPQAAVTGSSANGSQNAVTTGSNGRLTYDQIMQNQALRDYYQKQWMLTDTLDKISPIYNFESSISPAILYKLSGNTGPTDNAQASAGTWTYTPPSLMDSLAYVWMSILALIVELAVPVAITYVAFMRMDIQ